MFEKLSKIRNHTYNLQILIMKWKTFFTPAVLLYFSALVQAQQCPECYYVDGFTSQNASMPEIFDKSCEEGGTPQTKFLKNCGAFSKLTAEACSRLQVYTSHPEERLMTVRRCPPFLPLFRNGCSNWTTISIRESAKVPTDLKGFLRYFDKNTTLQICKCTGNDCEDAGNKIIEEPCPEPSFRCNFTRKCISFWDKCNGKWDCGKIIDENAVDVTDEENCDFCWTNGFYCDNLNLCIPVENWCDNSVDCGLLYTIPDENNCVNCSSDVHHCSNSTKCVPMKYRCDGTHHCGRNDTSDEDHCDFCQNNSFQCKHGSCIPQLARCNREKDCGLGDNSDEEDCESCHPITFHCNLSRICIPLQSRCNGSSDCGKGDNSDEENCVPAMPIDETFSVTEIGTLNLSSNPTNITYVLLDPDMNKIEFDVNKYQVLLTQLESMTYNIVLEISNATLEDEGNYTLDVKVVDENGKIKTYTFVFTVQVKNLLPKFPEFSYTNLLNSSISFTPGRALNLICVTAKLTGRSRSKVTWTWQNQSLRDWSPGINCTFGKNDETLLLNAVPIVEPGRFTCTAKNSIGSVTGYADIVVVASSSVNKIFGLVGPIGGVMGMLVLFLGLLILRYKWKQRKLCRLLYDIEKELYEGAFENINPDLHIKEQANLLPFEKGTWEIPRDHVILGSPLGSGAFGLVLKAEALEVSGEDKTTVAVKTVKTAADESHFKALVMELKIMANLGKNLNIVNLVGACTENFTKTRELLIVMEFCKFGSLLSFMLDNRKTFSDQLDPVTDKIDPTIIIRNSDSVNSVEDQAEPPKGKDDDGTPQDYYKGDYQETETTSLTSTDLLSWAYQIAKGMDYLASRKILHGDLAARNVLLAENNIAKICDFGYARETFKNYDYQKDTKGQLLPIKWMAIESLLCGVFSSKSDCWSYGILLWEMFTLGNKPYPGVIANEEFCQRVNDGYRMDIPPFAPTSIYQIMMDCWKHEPTERPTFSHIADQILELINETEQKRLHEMNDIYTTLTEVDKNTDYMMRMGEPTVFAVTGGQSDSMAMTSHQSSSQYGPEPTCSIKTNDGSGGIQFTSFR